MVGDGAWEVGQGLTPKGCGKESMKELERETSLRSASQEVIGKEDITDGGRGKESYCLIAPFPLGSMQHGDCWKWRGEDNGGIRKRRLAEQDHMEGRLELRQDPRCLQKVHEIKQGKSTAQGMALLQSVSYFSPIFLNKCLFSLLIGPQSQQNYCLGFVSMSLILLDVPRCRQHIQAFLFFVSFFLSFFHFFSFVLSCLLACGTVVK